jgi:hypothetical protein
MSKVEDHKESGDLASLKLFSALLIMNGYCGVVYGDGNCGYDIMALKIERGSDGGFEQKEYLFNLKQRDIPSGRYGDLVMDKKDFDALHWAQERRAGSKVLYVQFFTDGIICISNDKDWEEITRDCPTTTRFGNNEYVKKTLKQKSQSAEGVKRIDLNKISLDKLKNIYGDAETEPVTKPSSKKLF